MAYEYGVLPIAADNYTRMGQLKDLIVSKLSDVFTLDSDTGTGNSRVIKFVMPGNTRKLAILYSTQIRLYQRNLADTANLIGTATSGATAMAAYNAVQYYTIVKNVNSGCLIFSAGNIVLMWGSVDGIKRCAGPVNMTNYITEGGDTEIAAFRPGYSFPAVPLIRNDGKEIFLPTYFMGNLGTRVLSGPVPDIYSFKNQQGVALGSKFTMDGVDYLIPYAGMCIKIES